MASIGYCKEDSESAKALEELVNQHLKVGDSNEKIIAFLKSQGWVYGYDRFKKAYQARDPEEDKKQFSRNQVLIYVDDNKSFLRVEVETWYAIP